MKRFARRALEMSAFGRRLLKYYGLYLLRRRAAKVGDAKTFFTQIYETNDWDGAESVSGPGSTVAYTVNLRQELAALIERLGARRILDAPCGDFNWFKLIDLPEGATYIGGDIVEPLIAHNAATYGSENRSFRIIDIRRDSLPLADLWICRDVLFHLSNADIYATLRNCAESNIEYFLTTTHPLHLKNRDIPTGAFRLLNLECAPFNFASPLLRIDDWVEGEHVRQMCLWRREQVAEAVSRMSVPSLAGRFLVAPQ